MRLIRLLIAHVLERVATALRPPNIKTFLPREFLEKVLMEMPDQLWVEVIGPSMITTLSYYAPTGDGTVYTTSIYQEEGLMPQVFRLLLHEGAENKGVIKDPLAILSANHWALTEYLGTDGLSHLKAELDRLRRERDEPPIAEA